LLLKKDAVMAALRTVRAPENRTRSLYDFFLHYNRQGNVANWQKKISAVKHKRGWIKY
jgi:hypothetical protein